MNKETPTQWDVSDIDPTTMFPKDCRFYNGGTVAPLEVRRFWSQEKEEIKIQKKKGGEENGKRT